MKLTIDTKEDSHEEIRKAIKMLSAMVGDEHVYTNSAPKEHHANIFDSPSSSLGDSSPEPAPSEPIPNAFANMFGTVSSTPAETPAAEEQKEEEKEDKKPQIIVEY